MVVCYQWRKVRQIKSICEASKLLCHEKTVKLQYFYNRGLNDAQAILHSRIESITDAIYDIEKPTECSK